jgi:hypothetical protein
MRKTLYDYISEKYPHSINDSDMECIEDDIAVYLIQGFTLEECVDAAIQYYHNHRIFQDDPASCFGFGMREYLDE